MHAFDQRGKEISFLAMGFMLVPTLNAVYAQPRSATLIMGSILMHD